ncbi:glycosyltransferase family 4 protein [Luteolibacter flavescens]|uniref:Glycosyltransferase family 4 protein n=1 Tax=Luteolibacter flavescens TaxID=1859460 RepID=A0ABT3FP29_9BACT|nr:glycosyltransferase family 4 protein [Luteolibacter flavescens]MCW1885303.1 glycosyltransferase family 4 protein [Luteolibacter flavescens]
MRSPQSTRHVAFIGNYPPRRCGIATFTEDICEAIAGAFPDASCFAGAVNDRPEGYEYPARVRFEIDQDDPDSYTRAAEFLHINNVEVVSVQHEFGIYGGPAGSHLIGFLSQLRKPVVITLHTVLKSPDADQREVMRRLDELSERFVVMAERGQHLLEEVYGIDPAKIDLIPHGVIDMPFVDSNFYKDIFDAEGKTVLLTFGLLSPNKGIESAVEALPAILARNPEVVYLIVGATHPHLVAHQGETYRESLQALSIELGVAGNVIFHNRFVSMEELKEFIGGSDIYLTPYRNEEQITSGTLAYTFGAGKAIISTPYWHAQELLAEDRGILVPFADAAAIAAAVNDLLEHPTRMTAMRKRAWKEGRQMTWPQVARRYMDSFDAARAGLSVPAITAADNASYPVPPAKLDHLFRMTDHTGIFQHAIYSVPNYHEAYCTDDNARAFIYTVFHEQEHGFDPAIDRLASTYLAFLWYAFDANTRRFRNFMSHERHWLESNGSEDSHARALWAVGTALGHSNNEGFRNLSALLFQRGLEAVMRFSSPRAWAFTLVAIDEYLRAFSGDRSVAKMQRLLVGRLMGLFQANSSPDWQWFERVATYDNAKLPHALILSGQPEAIQKGLISLKWLINEQTGEGGQFSPIGCHGFWPQGSEKARFDQQPVEAHAMVSACMAAYDVTGEEIWAAHATRCFEWFLGRNDLGVSLYDPTTGGCRDALLRDHINQNQGAESTLAFHLSRSELTRRGYGGPCPT